jgi:hypothetical protein
MKVVLDVHVRCVKIKKFIDLNVVMRHLESKGLMEKYLC